MKKALLTTLGATAMFAGCTPGILRNPDLSAKYPEIKNARSQERAGAYDQAEKAYAQALEKQLPVIDRFWVLLDLADIYYDKLDEPQKALSLLDEASGLLPEKNPLLDEVFYRKGLCLERMGKTVDAAKAYEAVATQFRNSPWSQDALDGVERVFERNFKEYAARLIDPQTHDTVYITKLQLDKALDQIPPMYRPKYEKPEGKIELLERLLDKELALLEGKNLGIDTLASVMDKIVKAKRNALMRVYYQKEIQDKVEVPAKEIKKYYTEHKDQFKTPGQVRVKRIVVKDSAQAAELASLMEKGEDVDSLVKEFTVYKHEASRGGEFTAYSSQKVYEDFYNSVMALKDSVGVVPVSDSMWAAVLVLEKKEPGYKELKDVKTQIIRSIKGDKEREAWDAKRAALREKFGVKVMIDTTTQELPETLAVIGAIGKAITKKDFEAKLSEIPPMFKSRYDQPSGRMMLLDNMIDEEVVTQDADRMKMFLTSDVVKDVAQARSNAIMEGYYQEEISSKVQIPDSEITAFYKENRDNYRVPAQVKCRRIVVKSKKEARKVLKLLKDGEFTFDSLAKKFSILKGEGRRGGEITVFEKQEPVNFFKATFKKKPGYRGIVPFADTAWAVVEVEEVTKSTYRTLDEVKPQIERQLRADKEKQRAFALKDELKKKYQVEIYIKPEKSEDQAKPEPTPSEKPE